MHFLLILETLLGIKANVAMIKVTFSTLYRVLQVLALVALTGLRITVSSAKVNENHFVQTIQSILWTRLPRNHIMIKPSVTM